MNFNVYSVRDKLAGEAGPPFIAVNDLVAMRQFKQMGIPESLRNEYELLRVGYWDSLNAELTSHLTYTLSSEVTE